MARPPITNPAAYVSPMAVAFGDVDNKALTVTAETPLPVSIHAEAATTAALDGTLSEDGSSAAFSATSGRAVWLTLAGEWTGQAKLQRSTDGIIWRDITLAGEPWGQFSRNICEQIITESEGGAYYRLSAEVLSGTIAFRIAQ
ncbi:hypothetical protein GRI39_11325 [Altererythrobacter indicus]|uniref:DUF2793 domain-containing protein n=1 Tax=Altericroceibacterium indicum TaxID=374177 RepID=A0A845ADK2_9SPHN|nr:hypothetical protein [Altericroceibacterium indicum]MXP26626.1 hypothetical protein [Altericroceibacterium indicum]